MRVQEGIVFNILCFEIKVDMVLDRWSFSVVFFFSEVQEKSSRTSKIRDDYICRKAGAIYEYCWSI